MGSWVILLLLPVARPFSLSGTVDQCHRDAETLVWIEDVAVNYGPDRSYHGHRVRYINGILVRYGSNTPDVQTRWSRQLVTSRGSSLRNVPIEGDSMFTVANGQASWNDNTLDQYQFTTLLTVNDTENSTRSDIEQRGQYTLTLFASQGYFVLKREFQMQNWGNIFYSSPPCINVRRTPTAEVATSVGEDVTLTWEISGRHTARFTRIPYSPGTMKVDGREEELTSVPQRWSPWSSPPQLPSNIKFSQTHGYLSDNTSVVIYALYIESIGADDQAEYNLYLTSGSQVLQLVSRLVFADNGARLQSGVDIYLEKCDQNGASMESSAALGMTPDFPNCVCCVASGEGVDDVEFLKDGVPLNTTDTNGLSSSMSMRGRMERIYSFLDPDGDDEGTYSCRVTTLNGQTFQRQFTVMTEIPIDLTKVSSTFTMDQFTMVCRATGYPLPQIDFYRTKAWIGDFRAEGPLRSDGQNYEVTSQEVIGGLEAELIVNLPAANLTNDVFYCTAANMFGSYADAPPTEYLMSRRPTDAFS